MNTAPRCRATLVLTALAVLAASVLPGGAQSKAPRTLAFVVGIEHYDDGELDKIQFAADDARGVYELLKVVTDLDARSVLRVADDADKSVLTADTVRTELQKFVQLIDNNMNVVVYFGGHGTLSEADSLWYLPSNYSTTARTGYISFNEIRGMFVERIIGRSLYNTSLTFLVNMCGAGNAVVPGRTNLAVDNEREEVEAVQKLLSQQKFGLQKYAIIPATQQRVNTFEEEKLGSSVFAYHLRDGLKGAAASNGVVTTGSLFKFLETKLGSLARHGDFDPDIPLGVTQRIEGLSNYLVGSALLASAQALEGSPPSAERASHRAALLDLAADRLAAVPSSAVDLGTRALLRSTQVDALRNRRRGPSASNALSSSSGAPGGDAETRQLKELHADQAIATITLPALRQSLDDGAPFYALLLDSRTYNRAQDGDSEVGPWQAVLNSFKGLKGLQSIVMPSDGSLSTAILEAVTTWATADKDAARRARLIVVYVGVGGVQGADGKPIASPKAGSEGMQLYPFGRREVDRIAGAWSGPLTFFYLGPFGGVLLNGEPPVHHDVSLLLAAKELNGMTFSSYRNAGGGTAGLLARAFKEHHGNVEEYPPLLAFLRERGPGKTIGDDWVVGSPAWIPRWGQSTSRPSVERQLAPLRRFALHVSAGCADQQLETCDAASGAPDPFELLVKAAQVDLANASDTTPDYGEPAARLRAAASMTAKAPGADKARATLKALAGAVDRRSAAAKKRAARRVIVLTLGVEEYSSPLIADLPGTRKDLEAYGAALKGVFESAKIAALVRNVRMVENASDITAAIKTERDALGPDDLLVLVYSGRGLETGGRRYLSAGNARPCDRFAADPRYPCAQREWTELVDLWEIAELMRDRSLVAVYDTQFTAPVAEGRDDELLDKHLGSGRRALPDHDGRLSEAPRVKGESSPFEMREAGRLPARQLHIWFEGTLTAAVAPSSECFSEKAALASPLAAAIVGAMPASATATYREWLQEAADHPCLAESDADDSTPRTLVAQGAVDLPLLATSEGAEWVDYFRDDTGRSEANIRAAAAVVDDAMQQFPDNRNRLSKAAILLAVAALDRPGPGTSLGSLNEALSEVDELLKGVSLGTAEDRKDLRALLYELRARRWVLAGDPLQARVQLLNAEMEALVERNLAERLVSLTEDAIRLQPETLVEETAQRLDFADATFKSGDASKVIDPLGPARRRLDLMLRTEEMRRAGKYVIGPVVSR